MEFSHVDLEKKFLTGFLDDLNANRVTLPSLPEIAMRVRKLVQDPNVTAAQVEKVIKTDVVLSTRLLKVVNSPMYRGSAPIDNLRMAVTRLGTDLIRNIVTSLVMEQLYQARGTHPAIKKYLQNMWHHSAKVATLSQILCKHFTQLRPDQALLAGLVHDIGVMPVLNRVEFHPELLEDTAQLDNVLRRLHTMVGPTILDEWGFPPEIVAVAAEHEDITGKREGPVEYVDIVIVANLHSHIGTQHRLAKVDWDTVPAFARLGMTPEESLKVMEEMQAEMREIQILLRG